MTLFGSDHRYSQSKNWAKRHSLSLALAAVLLIQLIIAITTGYEEYVADSQTHGDPATTVGFIIWIIYELTASILADTYGALLLVLFAKWFYEQGSPESE